MNMSFSFPSTKPPLWEVHGWVPGSCRTPHIRDIRDLLILRGWNAVVLGPASILGRIDPSTNQVSATSGATTGRRKDNEAAARPPFFADNLFMMIMGEIMVVSGH